MIRHLQYIKVLGCSEGKCEISGITRNAYRRTKHNENPLNFGMSARVMGAFYYLTRWKQTVTWAQFHQRSTYSFYALRSQKHKKDNQVVNLFYTFGIYERKSFS